MDSWYSIVSRATWMAPEDVRRTFNTVDKAFEFTIFDVAAYRIVADIAFTQGRLFIKHVFTHTEYDTWTQQQRRR